MSLAQEPCVVLPFVPQEIAHSLQLNKDGLDRPLNMVLSAKIEDFNKSTLQVCSINLRFKGEKSFLQLMNDTCFLTLIAATILEKSIER